MSRRRMKKSPIVHRTKLFGGAKSAEEIHAEFGFRKRCLACGGTPVIRVRMMMTLIDFTTRAPDMAAMIAASNPDGPFIPTIPTTFGQMVKYADVTACKHHQKELEKEAAKAPSFVLVEIDRGPGSDKPFVQVAG